MPSPCCSLRHSVARPDGARSRALFPVRLCALLPPFVCQGRHDLSRARLVLDRASMLRIDAARVTLTAGIARITLAGVRGSGWLNVDKGKSTHLGSGSRQHLHAYMYGHVRSCTVVYSRERFAAASLRRIFLARAHPPRGDFRQRGAVRHRERPRPALHLLSTMPLPPIRGRCRHRARRRRAGRSARAARPSPRCLHPPRTFPPQRQPMRYGFGGFGSSGVRGGAPLPRHCTASGRRDQDGLRPACGG